MDQTAQHPSAKCLVLSGSEVLLAPNPAGKGTKDNVTVACERATGDLTGIVRAPYGVARCVAGMSIAHLPGTELQVLRTRNVPTVFLGTDDAAGIPYFAVDVRGHPDEQARTKQLRSTTCRRDRVC